MDSMIERVFKYFGLVSGGLLVAYIVVGAVSFNYVLGVLFGKNVPAWLDALAGLILGGFAMIAAVACLVAEYCGVEAPFFPVG
jgi:hypothetical protein